MSPKFDYTGTLGAAWGRPSEHRLRDCHPLSISGHSRSPVDAISVRRAFRDIAFLVLRRIRLWHIACSPSGEIRAEVSSMKKTERIRQIISAPLQPADLQQQTEQGWKLVALEWEREIETAEAPLPGEIPFGLQISPDARRLEESPIERELLFLLMELMVEEGSYARIAEEINRRGFRTRQGDPWTPISVFEMLPRLIEVGPHVFQSSEWQKRRQHLNAAALSHPGQ